MDRETADEIKRHVTEGLRELRTEIQEVGQHSDVVAERLTAELRAEIQDVKRHSDVIAQELRAEIQDVRTELRTEIQEGRRHSDVVAESLRSEIRLVAEGVTGLDEKFSVEFKKVREEIGELNGFLRLSYADLDRRKMDKPS